MERPGAYGAILDRMEYGQTTLNALLRSLGGRRLVVRAAIERSPKLTVRMMVVDALPQPPLVGREVSDYGRGVFIEMAVSADRLGRWLKKGRARVSGLLFSVPKAQDQVSWSRHPSHTASGPVALRWPITRFDVHSSTGSPANPRPGFLVADGLPTFMQFEEAAAYYLYADLRAQAQMLGSSLCTVRVADTRGYIEKIHVGAANLTLHLRGDEVVGARCELTGGGARQEKAVGGSRRVRLPLPAGLADDRMLMLSLRHDWLDYRFLSQRTLFEDRTDVFFDPPDLCTQVALLARQGEGPAIEYKSMLPTEKGHKEKLARTVVAFANTGGGTIIYGIAPDGPDETKVVGLAPFHEPLDHLTRIIRDGVSPDPPVQMTSCELDGKTVIAVFVLSVAERFFTVNATPPQFYVRRGGNNFPATLADIRELAKTTITDNQAARWNRLR